MRELKGNEIGQVAGAGATWSQLASIKWSHLTSVSKSIPVVNDIFTLVNDLLGTKIPYLNVK